MKTPIYDDKIKEIIIDAINEGSEFVLNASRFYEHIRTIYKIEKQRCFNLYKKFYSEVQQERNQLKNEKGALESTDKIIATYPSRIERMNLAGNIARMQSYEIGETTITPTPSDAIRALDYLSKIEGDYSPEKHEIETIPPITFTILENNKDDED